MLRVTFFLAFLAATSSAFSLSRGGVGPLLRRRAPLRHAAYVGDLLTSAGWAQTKRELDTVPVFTCANKKGEPALYEINDRPAALFFTNVDDAKDELLKCNEAREADGLLNVVPFPLGEAFRLVLEDEALLVPSAAAVAAAGAPLGTNPLGQPVTLFACTDIMRERDDGAAVLPLFFVYAEAQEAVAMAIAADGAGDGSSFDIVGLPLQQAVEVLAASPGTTAFQFVTPVSSLDHVRTYWKEGQFDKTSEGEGSPENAASAPFSPAKAAAAAAVAAAEGGGAPTSVKDGDLWKGV